MATVIVAAMDGLAIQRLMDPARDHQALSRAPAFLMLCSLAASYAEAGQRVPPIAQMLEAFGGGGAAR